MLVGNQVAFNLEEVNNWIATLVLVGTGKQQNKYIIKQKLKQNIILKYPSLPCKERDNKLYVK